MNEFDEFCAELLEESKRFLEKAKQENNVEGKKAYRFSSLLLSSCALEAYINGISEELSITKNFPIHLKGILLEKEIRLEKGDFVFTKSLKMSRLKDKIEVLYIRYIRKELNDRIKWWGVLQNGIDLRNKITHPKETINVTDEFLEIFIQAILDCLTELYKAIYKRRFPKSNLSIKSRLDF